MYVYKENNDVSLKISHRTAFFYIYKKHTTLCLVCEKLNTFSQITRLKIIQKRNSDKQFLKSVAKSAKKTKTKHLIP